MDDSLRLASPTPNELSGASGHRKRDGVHRDPSLVHRELKLIWVGGVIVGDKCAKVLEMGAVGEIDFHIPRRSRIAFGIGISAPANRGTTLILGWNSPRAGSCESRIHDRYLLYPVTPTRSPS